MKYLFSLLLCAFILQAEAQQLAPETLYQCKPCGRECDSKVFASGGHCIDCHMELVPKSSVSHKTLDANNLCQYLAANPKVVLLDVRTEEEFENRDEHKYGTIKKAMNVPVNELEKKISKLQKYKDREILVYCSHGHRSAEASYMLTRAGFTNITNLTQGVSALPAGTPCLKY